MKRKTFLTHIVLPSLILALGIMFANTRRQAQAQETKSNTAVSINTAFTYQGRLTDSDDAADGVYDFQFKLHDAETGGGQVGSPSTSDDIAVAGGPRASVSGGADNVAGGSKSSVSGGGYTLSWWTVDNGGGTSNGGAYAVSGTLGQPDAGSLLNGGPFGIQGGFWTANDTVVSPSSAHAIYLPLIVTE